MNPGKNGSFWESLNNAGKGVVRTIIEERNMKIHMLCAQWLCHIGVVFPFSFMERMLLFFLMCLILALEVMNSGLEAAVDLLTQKRNYKARSAKEGMSGGILVLSVGATAMLVNIFGNYVDYFMANLLTIFAGFAIGLAHGIAIWFLLAEDKLGKRQMMFVFCGLLMMFLQFKLFCNSILFAMSLIFLFGLTWLTQWKHIRDVVLE